MARGRKKPVWRNNRIVFIGILAGFLLLKTVSFHYSLTDEDVYFYMGKILADGKVPYRDFFFAHPPLGIIPNAVIFSLFGFNLVLLKSVTIVSYAISGCLLYRIVLKSADEKTALLASALFFFSFSTLTLSSYQCGMELTVLFMLAGFDLHLTKKHFASGLALGLGAATGMYSLVLAGCLGLHLLWARRFRGAALYSLGFVLFMGAVSGFFYMLAGDEYLRDVFFYHVAKPGAPVHNSEVPLQVIGSDPQMFIPLLGVPLLARGRKKDGFAVLTAYIVLAYALFLLSLNVMFDYYFMLMIPFVCMLSAKSVMAVAGRCDGSLFRAAAASAVLLSLYWVLPPYLLQESVHFENAAAVSDYITANAPSDALIYGDAKVAPLMSILTGRGIALEETDTSIMRFMSKTTGIDVMLSRLRGTGRPIVLILHSKYGIWTLPDVREYVRNDCRPFVSFNERAYGEYNVFLCQKRKVG